ncbi:MAG: DUF971 domain-containing protein [Phycisphaerales bacterium]|nr:DUF971 domain-containing protein [Phycisphaerales bacterium]
MEPVHLDLKKDRGLTIEWSDGTTSYYTIAYLRRMSPSADQRKLRDEMASNPLTVLPSRPATTIEATSADLVGNYAIRIEFSDGHASGIFSWVYLRSIDPGLCDASSPEAGSHDARSAEDRSG